MKNLKILLSVLLAIAMLLTHVVLLYVLAF